MANPQQEEIDPAIYQYDEIYDEIKGKQQDEKADRGRTEQRHREDRGSRSPRSRSRSKERKERKEEKPRQSKYIGKMKQVVAGRQKDHQAAYEKKIVRENERLGVNEEMVFVTESYLKKKEEEKEAARLRKAEEERNEREAPEKGSYLDFKKKMLQQQLYRK